jgi:tetratricopeptide (TPR) repeat protein
MLRLSAVLIVASIGLSSCSNDPPRHSAATGQLGKVEFATSCDSAVRVDFNHAVALLHHMTYAQARTSFQAIADRDPRCAMAHWGIAMTLFQPLWPTRPGIADLQLGWQSVQTALALDPPTPREQAYIRAAGAFFEGPSSTDYWQRIDRWEAAMMAVHKGFPDDTEATAFYALALLASARPGPTLQQHSQQAIALLLPIYRQHPDHPGAMHYIIHANDIPGREHENLDVVRRYEEIAPDNAHAIHMPTHIYTRLGDWDGVIRGNLRAAAVALQNPAGAHGEFVSDEFAHAVEYLVYAYLQQGADAQAAAQIARLLATANLEPTAKTAFHLASTRARYALERHAWNEAAALIPREPPVVDWERFPWPESVTWFARGYGAMRSGNLAECEHAIARLRELQSRAEKSGETVFARQIQMLGLELAGWSAHATHDDAAAALLLRQAVDLEGDTPKPAVTPAATLPASELLGDLLLELARPAEALAAYQQSLQRFPRRFNSTLGIVRSAMATGDVAGAQESYCELLRLGASGSRVKSLDDLRILADRAKPCPPIGIHRD